MLKASNELMAKDLVRAFKGMHVVEVPVEPKRDRRKGFEIPKRKSKTKPKSKTKN